MLIISFFIVFNPLTLTSPTDLLLGNKDNSAHIIIAVTSDRGLCGGFNSSIVKSVKNKVKELEENNIQIIGPSIKATYYGPFTLAPFRRNESMYLVNWDKQN